MGEEYRELGRGVLARLRPVPRALWIIALSALLIGFLVLLDPSEAGRKWADNPAEEIERYLNTLVLAGTVWAVVLEGDAILAALGVAIVGGVGGLLTRLLKAAGASEDEIARILKDISDALKRKPQPDKSASSSGANPSAAEESSQAKIKSFVHSGVKEEQASARDTQSPPPDIAAHKQRKRSVSSGWQRRLTYAVCGAVVFAALLSVLKLCAVPVEPEEQKRPPPPPEMVEIRGSVSETLVRCLGRQPGVQLETRVAEFNKLKCEERSTGLHCLVRDGGSLLLPLDVRCAPPAP